MADRSLNVAVAEDVVAGLEELARETGRSPQQLANEALRQYVSYERWKARKVKAAIARADMGDFASDAEIAAVFERYKDVASPSK
jgi:RHH-type transcriptional regulator, rel operon repressor / antitoxin RelB